jgi:serine/threonine protein kinase
MLLPAIRLHRVISKDQTGPKRKRQEISVASIKKKSTMLEEYEMKNKIGSGAFAEVFVALNPGGKGKFVVKIYDKFKLYDKQRKLNIKNEISILKKLNHPNIIELVEVIENPKTINLVMEHFSEISLRKAIGDRGKFNEGECKKVIKQLAEAI